MKKLGKFNLIEEHICELHCDCGWNIRIGGKSKKDLEEIKEYLREWPAEVDKTPPSSDADK